MKRITVLVLVATMMVCAGCSNKSASKDSTEVSTEVVKAADSIEKVEEHSIDEYNTSDYVTLGKYKGLEIKVDKVEVAEDFRETTIADLQSKHLDYKDTDEKKVKKDSIVKINIESANGDMTEDLNYAMGVDGSFADYEKNWIAKEVGYVDKTDEYTFTINGIVEAVAPEITDEWIAENTDSKTLDEYIATLEENTLADLRNTQTNEFRNEVMEEVLADSKFKDLPEELVLSEVYEYKVADAEAADEYGLSLEDFVTEYYGYDDMDAYEDSVRTYAEDNIKSSFLLKAIGDAEKVKVSDDDYKAFVADTMEDYGFSSEEELLEAYSENIVQRAAFNSKVWEILTAENKMIEE